MKQLLAIINDPNNARPFINYVVQMASDIKANAHFMYIINPNNYLLGAPGATGAVTIEVQHKLKELAESAQKELSEYIQQVQKENEHGIKLDFSLDTGVTSFLVRDIVDKDNFDFLVIEGEEENSRNAQLSVNMDVVRKVNCPVWIIPYKAEYKPYDRIMYATDYKEEDVPTLRRLLNLTRDYSPEITALHVTNDMNFEERVKKAGFNEMLQENMHYKNLDFKVMTEKQDEDLTEKIHEYAWLQKAELIALLNENKGFFDRIFNPDQTKLILEHTDIPVLVFHKTDE